MVVGCVLCGWCDTEPTTPLNTQICTGYDELLASVHSHMSHIDPSSVDSIRASRWLCESLGVLLQAHLLEEKECESLAGMHADSRLTSSRDHGLAGPNAAYGSSATIGVADSTCQRWMTTVLDRQMEAIDLEEWMKQQQPQEEGKNEEVESATEGV